MNIKDFLIENYIYIIIIIVLIIVTIIGFLADKKKNGTKKMQEDPSSNKPGASNAAPPVAPQNVQPMTYNPVTENVQNKPMGMPVNQNPVPVTSQMGSVSPQPQQIKQPIPTGMNMNTSVAMPTGNVIPTQMAQHTPVNTNPVPMSAPSMSTPVNPVPAYNNPVQASVNGGNMNMGSNPVPTYNNMPSAPSPIPNPNTVSSMPGPMPMNPNTVPSPVPIPNQPSNPMMNGNMKRPMPNGYNGMNGNNQMM